MPGRTTSRGYGNEHQKLRREWAPIVATGTVRCARCHELIPPGARWDLGHVDGSKHLYRGPEHSACNRATSRHRVQREQAQREGQVRQWYKPPPGTTVVVVEHGADPLELPPFTYWRREGSATINRRGASTW